MWGALGKGLDWIGEGSTFVDDDRGGGGGLVRLFAGGNGGASLEGGGGGPSLEGGGGPSLDISRVGGGGGPGLPDDGTGGALTDGGGLVEGNDGADVVLAVGLWKPGIGILGADVALLCGTGGLTNNNNSYSIQHIIHQVIRQIHINHLPTQ